MLVGDRNPDPDLDGRQLPNPRWWDAGPVRAGPAKEPPDSFNQEAFQDAMAAMVADQETPDLDISPMVVSRATTTPTRSLYYFRRRGST